MRIVHAANGLTINGRLKDRDFAVNKIINTDVVGGSTSQTNVKDVVIETTTLAQVTTTPSLLTTLGLAISTESPEYTSLTPAIATIDQDGVTSYVADGMANLQVAVKGVGKKVISSKVLRSVSASSEKYVGWVDGSLAKHMNDQVVAAIVGKAANAANQNRFSTGNGVDQFVRSNAHALAAIDLTAFAATQSWVGWTGGNRATAISPRHVIGAHHWFPPLNQNITFVAADNTLVVRQIVSSQQIGSTDIQIGYLNADLPASITPLMVLPATFLSYLPSINYRLPIYYDFNPGVIHVGALSNFFGNSWSTGKDADMFGASNPGLTPWWQWRGGSGSPCFTVINGAPVLIFCLHYGSTPFFYGGPFVSNYINEINAAMTALHGSAAHQLQEVTLSGFPTY